MILLCKYPFSQLLYTLSILLWVGSYVTIIYWDCLLSFLQLPHEIIYFLMSDFIYTPEGIFKMISCPFKFKTPHSITSEPSSTLMCHTTPKQHLVWLCFIKLSNQHWVIFSLPTALYRHLPHTLPLANLTLMMNSQNTSSFLKLKLMSNYIETKHQQAIKLI